MKIKKFVFILLLNILLVFIINLIAYFFSTKSNTYYFYYILVWFVIITFILIIFDVLKYIYNKIINKDHNFYLFLFLLSALLIFKIYFLSNYFYTRASNIFSFELYFLKDFGDLWKYILNDFRDFNWAVLINFVNNILPKTVATQFYIYTFFQFLGWIYLYRLFKLFTSNKLLVLLLTFLYFGIQMFFIIAQTLEYINILLSSFIIFIFYIFYLESKKSWKSYIMYFSSYQFLITSRPDFFFLSLIIEALNSYFSSKKIISLTQNILFYILLIPYYFVINNYLLNNFSSDKWMLYITNNTSNFWYTFFDNFFWYEMINKFFINIKLIINDYIFLLMLIFIFISFIYFNYYKKVKNKFSEIFLFSYMIFFFFIVIFLHREWFINSFFKYISVIYIIVYIIFWIFIIKFDDVIKNKTKRNFLYTWLFLFLVLNYSISLWNYFKLDKNLNIWTELKKYHEIDKIKNQTIYDRINNVIFDENILYYKDFLNKYIKSECKKVLIWKFYYSYNSLYPEYWVLPWEGSIENLKNEKCIILIDVYEWFNNYSNKENINLDTLKEYFNDKLLTERIIEKDFRIFIYELKKKNDN